MGQYTHKYSSMVLLALAAVAVLSGGQGENSDLPVPHPPPPMKLVAKYQSYIIPVFTAWHLIAGVILHHSLNHVLCHP